MNSAFLALFWKLKTVLHPVVNAPQMLFAFEIKYDRFSLGVAMGSWCTQQV
jgi:hypothetical protein